VGPSSWDDKWFLAPDGGRVVWRYTEVMLVAPVLGHTPQQPLGSLGLFLSPWAPIPRPQSLGSHSRFIVSDRAPYTSQGGQAVV
jgi:hypothetical protein